MIVFRRDGKLVKCEIECSVPHTSGFTFNLYFQCNDDAYAGLLADRFHKEMRSKLEEIRRKSYEDGYKAGRAKKEKRKYFDWGWA